MKLIKEYTYMSKDMVETTIRVFRTEEGIVLEQTRSYDREANAIDSIFIPKEVFEND